MNFEVDSGKILKIVVGVLALIVLVLIISSCTSKEEVPKVSEVQSVILDRKTLNMNPGETYTLRAIISPSNAVNQVVTYSSNNTYVATVDNNGFVRALNPGEARMTVLTPNGKQDQCVITVVEEKIPVTSLSLDQDDVILTEGESMTLKLTVEPSNTTDHNYTWTSSDASVATVDSSGKVVAKKAGSTLITVMSENKKMAICDIEVKEKVTKITIDKKEATTSVGNKVTLKAILEPIDSKAEVTWSSSDTSIATVNAGVVTGVKSGEVTITAKAGALSATSKIKVKIVTTSDIYTFKYVQNQMDKPLIGCNTYTASDRAKLEDQLARAVERVGYGTRAGVVEAARFLVGALDYRIPYLGPKKAEVDPERILGMYSKKGLNIGHNRGWGCYVYGWRQGMDCTNFVSWAFKQNGLSLNDVYSTHNTFDSTSAVSRIRPGDLMLSPCYNSCRFEGTHFSHVGIVIGVTSDKIYVAESTTGTINSIVITVLEKNNMPTRYKFATVRIYDKYPAEGKLTDMWD